MGQSHRKSTAEQAKSIDNRWTELTVTNGFHANLIHSLWVMIQLGHRETKPFRKQLRLSV
jgi:hypothetical protein